jgi:DNA invertase Pin-like site-specific DNA recombinase
MNYGYARISTEEQNSAMQISALKKSGSQKIFKDEGISGTTLKRPGFENC